MITANLGFFATELYFEVSPLVVDLVEKKSGSLLATELA